jgi:multidrug efflux system membrane fusion protein
VSLNVSERFYPSSTGAGWRRTTVVVPLLALALAGCEPTTPPPSEAAEVSRPAQIQRVAAADLSSDLRFPGPGAGGAAGGAGLQRAGADPRVPGQRGRCDRIRRVAGALGPGRLPDDAGRGPGGAGRRHRRLRARAQALGEEPGRGAGRGGPQAHGHGGGTLRTSRRPDRTWTTPASPHPSPASSPAAAENFQNVQAKEPVVSLQNPDALEIVIHVPERVMRGEPRRAAGFAVFDDMPERRSR